MGCLFIFFEMSLRSQYTQCTGRYRNLDSGIFSFYVFSSLILVK